MQRKIQLLFITSCITLYTVFSNAYFSSLEFFQMIADDMELHYPIAYKEKKKRGEKINQHEKDKFENEYGRYKNRTEISVMEIMAAINNGMEIKVH